MLEPILKGLTEWVYQLMVSIMSYASGELIGVLSMDLAYFEGTAPAIKDITNIFIALGWALLIGNMVFQLLKSMMSGIGFEAEDPKILFLRTFVFGFLLLSSRQICNIGLGISSKIIDLLKIPRTILILTPSESMFDLGDDAKWLLVIIVGVILMCQMVKLLFEIGERYVITSVLTFFAPLAFSMGGSRNTSDIFKGWCRMYCSMLIMMIMNIVFLKLIMSGMTRMARGGVLVWLVFIVALTRVARKIDAHIGKIGLNPAQTGDGLGSRLPGVMTMMAVKVVSSAVSKNLSCAKGSTGGKGSVGGGNNTNYTNNNHSRGYHPNEHLYNGNNHSTRQQPPNANVGSINTTTPPSRTSEQQSSHKLTSNEHEQRTTDRTRASGSANRGMTQEQHRGMDNPGNNTGYKHTSQTPNRPPLPRNTSGRGVNKGANVNNIQDVIRADNTHKTTPQGKQSNTVENSLDMGNRTIPDEKWNTDGLHGKNTHSNEHNIQQNGVNKSEAHDVVSNPSLSTNMHDTQSKVIRDSEKARINAGNNTSRNVQERSVHHTENGSKGVEDRKVNHQYKNGRYNPAAVNKKTKQSYLKKDIHNGLQGKNRGVDNGNDKRKKWC